MHLREIAEEPMKHSYLMRKKRKNVTGGTHTHIHTHITPIFIPMVKSYVCQEVYQQNISELSLLKYSCVYSKISIFSFRAHIMFETELYVCKGRADFAYILIHTFLSDSCWFALFGWCSDTVTVTVAIIKIQSKYKILNKHKFIIYADIMFRNLKAWN